MAECSEISLMLGAFEDSELEPNEMQDVAFHLARCESCTAILADYSTVGRDLRAIAVQPQLVGFSSAVIARIDRLPQPFMNRVARWFQRRTESIGAGFALGTAVAAVAALTAIMITPYAQIVMHRQVPASIAQAIPAAPSPVAPVDVADSDQADISRLESPKSSVAVWSAPHTDTTVIWLPDQQ